MQRRTGENRIFVAWRPIQRRGWTRKARVPRDKCTDIRRSSIPTDWVVGLEGTELPTPHPVVEPVSDIRVRNGIFRCRDGPVRTAFSSAGDRYGDAGGLEKARVPRHKCADIRWSSIPEDWVVVCAVLCEPVSTWNSRLSGNLSGNFEKIRCCRPKPSLISGDLSRASERIP